MTPDPTPTPPTPSPETTSSEKKHYYSDTELLEFLLERCHCYTGSPEATLFRLDSRYAVTMTMHAIAAMGEERRGRQG